MKNKLEKSVLYVFKYIIKLNNIIKHPHKMETNWDPNSKAIQQNYVSLNI